MPQEEFLSAVAKRRRLNGNLPSVASTLPSTNQPPSPSKALVEKSVRKPESLLSGKVAAAEVDNNSFAALVSKDVVQFSSSREVERLNDLTLKIRLSKGQKCIISGRYTLWIKDGTIELLGARLEACTKVYNVCAIAANEIPAIVALSKSAEVEISSNNHANPLSLGSKTFEYETKDARVASFVVHGYSALEDSTETNVVRAFDSSIFNNVARGFSQLELDENAVHGPTVLLCGRNLVGSSIAFACVLNNVVTSKVRGRKHPANHGTLVLDLDITAPAFTPAGTASLVHISEPLLGPSWHFPADFTSQLDAGPIRILQMLNIGEKKETQGEKIQFDALLEHLSNIRQERYHGCPVIVKACNLLTYMNVDRALNLTNQLAPNIVVCYGSEGGSINAQLGSLVVTESKIAPPVIIPISSAKEYPLAVQHELTLQSYYHARGYSFGQPIWSYLPLELDQSCRVWLSIRNRSTSGLEIRIPETSVDAGTTIDALAGCMVAVNCARGSQDLTKQDSQRSAGSVQEPRLDSTGRPLECLGFAIVAGFSSDKESMCLLTPISHLIFDRYRKNGGCIVLVVHPADLDGRYDTAWVQSELDTLVEDKRVRKTVFRRKLHVL